MRLKGTTRGGGAASRGGRRGGGTKRRRRRKEESRVNRGQVALPDASRATTLFQPLAPLIQTTLPHFPPRSPPARNPRSARPPLLLLLFSRLPSPPRPIQTSAALPPSLPSSRKGRAGLGGQPPPRDVRLSRTHHRDDGVRRHLRALARAGLRRPSYKFGRRLDAPPLLLPFSIFFSSFSASLFGDENFLAGCRDAASSPCRANSPPSAKSELTEI